MSARPGNNCPPAVGAAEGRGIALGANAGRAYRAKVTAGKAEGTGGKATRHASPDTIFRSQHGRVWCYSGKRGRVLAMLATGQGVTQWDTLPWHTRLGGTIPVLRGDGFVIETVREGEYRYARYRRRTPGKLDNGGEA